jgi:hypothetical protein
MRSYNKREDGLYEEIEFEILEKEENSLIGKPTKTGRVFRPVLEGEQRDYSAEYINLYTPEDFAIHKFVLVKNV